MMKMMQHSRAAILQRLRAKVAAGQPIVGGGAGTGISAKSEEAGGIDLIVIYNSGRYRMAGRGSLSGLLSYGNANQVVKEMACEILTAVEHTPILAGVCGTDPFLLRDSFLLELKSMGFAGIQNFPTVGLIDGMFRANLEETGMSYRLEVEVIARAHELDLLTTPYVFNIEETRHMVEAGADIVVAHRGLTTSGTIGAQTARSLEACVVEVQAIADVAKTLRDDCLVLCHGGPIAMPADAQYVLDRCVGVDGFYGASSMERLPTETSIADQVRQFRDMKLPRGSAASNGNGSKGNGAAAHDGVPAPHARAAQPSLRESGNH
jgi:predicted TIM-barrel enzyme